MGGLGADGEFATGPRAKPVAGPLNAETQRIGSCSVVGGRIRRPRSRPVPP